MKIIDNGGEIKISDVADFSIVKIFECGQCFRWNADERGIYTGIAQGRVVHIRQDAGNIIISCTLDDFNAIWHDYLDLANDYAQIRERLAISDFMKRVISFGMGIRILHQDLWEALCTFILSQNNHIPRIKKLTEALCKEFGNRIEFGGKTYYTFPEVDAVASLSESDLSPLRLGYRAEYVINAAKAVSSGSLNLDELSQLHPREACAQLKKIRGVGDKVAHCTMLFGLHMLDSFPVDIWVRRAVSQYLGNDFDPTVFSPYAGIAQQYIFYYIRSLR